MEHTNPVLLWPFIVYSAAVLLLVAGMMVASYFLGEKHSEKATNQPYEAGIKPTGSARLQFPIHFYLIAMFFVVFDLEAVFIFTWAISVKETGWVGYFSILIFIVELIVLLIYLWRIGALEFGPNGKVILQAYHKKIKKDNFL
ncbi:NADH-quinone oxidoreductase subunit A [Gillisia sp. Hel_I_86]|uniref:NADH-quinone oxidoreductase subunit A n=1 Tax=Gillisia sp. Hel_I_86 TaxID=1249981 RepID=UPI0011998160|nr:NADH-quinone oxidoreductase subunit A [Gillisia sp. Hel_I_86]TVZ28649.1 NADH-quinone oxidoreductase subunit A [Gillisia sp. Hel_I_86]